MGVFRLYRLYISFWGHMGAYGGLYMAIFIFCKIHPLGGGLTPEQTYSYGGPHTPPYAPKRFNMLYLAHIHTVQGLLGVNEPCGDIL